METTGDDDEERTQQYWRAENFVAKASTDELTGNWLTDKNGILDEDAAGDTWDACREVDMQAADEVTEQALDRFGHTELLRI